VESAVISILVIKLRGRFQYAFWSQKRVGLYTKGRSFYVPSKQERITMQMFKSVFVTTSRFLLALALVVFLPAQALAQASACQIPNTLPEARAETPPAGEVRNVPPTGYTLALSWSPQFCRQKGDEPKNDLQCSGSAGRFGFILHGLWPDGPGRDDPAWCAPAKPLSTALIKRNLCMMPSVHLQQHEWAKHGTCATSDPDRYFRAASLLFNAVKWPDMDRLSRSRPSMGRFIGAFTAANPGLRSDMIQVQTAGGNWLSEVRICLGTDYKPRTCPRDSGRTRYKSALKIWRNEK
jgi:ribonuclease T2